MVLKLYEHSLSIMFLPLFLASFALHAIGGAEAYSSEQQSHGQPPVTVLAYLGTSRSGLSPSRTGKASSWP